VCRFLVVRALQCLSSCLMTAVDGTKTEMEAEEKRGVGSICTGA
jgi:hypothetical protein